MGWWHWLLCQFENSWLRLYHQFLLLPNWQICIMEAHYHPSPRCLEWKGWVWKLRVHLLDPMLEDESIFCNDAFGNCGNFWSDTRWHDRCWCILCPVQAFTHIHLSAFNSRRFTIICNHFSRVFFSSYNVQNTGAQNMDAPSPKHFIEVKRWVYAEWNVYVRRHLLSALFLARWPRWN